MTTRRRLLVFGMLAGALALGGGVWLLWPRTAITRENAAKVQEGMILADVEAILGGPARDETRGADTLQWAPSTSLSITAPPFRYEQWVSTEYGIAVQFRDGRVIRTYFGEPMRGEESPLQKVRRWLGL